MTVTDDDHARLKSRVDEMERLLDQMSVYQALKFAELERQRNSKLTKIAVEGDPGVILGLDISTRRQVLRRMPKALSWVIANVPDARSWIEDLPPEYQDALYVATAALPDVIEYAVSPGHVVDAIATYDQARRLRTLGVETEERDGHHRLVRFEGVHRVSPEQWDAMRALHDRLDIPVEDRTCPYGRLPSRLLTRPELQTLALQERAHAIRCGAMPPELPPLHAPAKPVTARVEHDDETPATTDATAPRSRARKAK